MLRNVSISIWETQVIFVLIRWLAYQILKLFLRLRLICCQLNIALVHIMQTSISNSKWIDREKAKQIHRQRSWITDLMVPHFTLSSVIFILRNITLHLLIYAWSLQLAQGRGYSNWNNGEKTTRQLTVYIHGLSLRWWKKPRKLCRLELAFLVFLDETALQFGNARYAMLDQNRI